MRVLREEVAFRRLSQQRTQRMAIEKRLEEETTPHEQLSLEQQVERLGARDWRVGLAAHTHLSPLVPHLPLSSATDWSA